MNARELSEVERMKAKDILGSTEGRVVLGDDMGGEEERGAGGGRECRAGRDGL